MSKKRFGSQVSTYLFRTQSRRWQRWKHTIASRRMILSVRSDGFMNTMIFYRFCEVTAMFTVDDGLCFPWEGFVCC